MSLEMSDFQKMASAAALSKMFKEKNFSICTLDSIAKTMGVEANLSGRDYSALRSVHCMEWRDMGESLSKQVKEKCLELLGIHSSIVEMADEVTKEPEVDRSSGFLSWFRPSTSKGS